MNRTPKSNGDDELEPKPISEEIDAIAGLSDALKIVSQAADNGNYQRCARAMAALADEISRRLDNLYGVVREAIDVQNPPPTRKR